MWTDEHWQKKEEQGFEVKGSLQTDTQTLGSESGFLFCISYKKKKKIKFPWLDYHNLESSQTS